MSRVAKNPVHVASGVQVAINGQSLSLKGAKGALQHVVHELVKVVHEENMLRTVAQNDSDMADALAGSTRALVNNMMKGVTEGFERKLELLGVGYRAQVQGKKLNLTLGFSHPVAYDIPQGITIETPSQTEIIVKGADKQLVGQVSAEIRAYRPPEPYKGKGVRYVGERIILKETKKK
jgi:large subunit ribosomal protein L6